MYPIINDPQNYSAALYLRLSKEDDNKKGGHDDSESIKNQRALLEGYAKEHRPWTDRTGDARKRLTSYVTDIPNGYRINLAHGVDYGIWLELAMEKRFAILEPTVRLQGQEVLRGMNRLLEEL